VDSLDCNVVVDEIIASSSLFCSLVGGEVVFVFLCFCVCVARR